MDSSNSFESFGSILSEQPSLSVRLAEHEMYHAHTHQQKPSELLVEHVDLVIEYALRLIRVHRLEPIVERLIEPLVAPSYVTAPDETANFIKRLFLNTIVFHDYGKVNENFQVERMKNLAFEPNPANGIGSKHSILSTFLFISEHAQDIHAASKFDPETQAALYALTFWLSNAILKHHAPYIENDLTFDPEKLLVLKPYLAQIGLSIDDDFLRAVFDGFEKKIKQFSEICFPESCRFPIYALLKLNFSLLTAADYYATSDFMMGMKTQEFGVLSDTDKKALSENFRVTMNYNRQFFEKQQFFQSFSESNLATCTPENLNILRQKLLGEVLSRVHARPDEPVFYLEAPTGSGKTNLSLAAALQLLEIHPALNKIFYVFPFTTLITQTAQALQETLGLTSAQMVQLHSRSGFHSKREESEDGRYGAEKLNYIDNLFVNYPVTLLTHIKFFDVLKGNGKESTYLLHRLANSIVIIDELQSYPPKEWDKIVYLIRQYAQCFNMKFILMSATLPKLDNLEVSESQHSFCPLVQSKERYFQNANFKHRVTFDFSLLEQKPDLESLAEFILQKSEEYASEHGGKVKAIIEFIYKRSATEFYNIVEKRAKQAGYNVLVLSGVILEPRRREIIELIKSKDDHEQHSENILLISTQVVEAGVDIDMDIGFKDRSLIDSDEQLAGRVNRNARPDPATVYIFDLDRTYNIYGCDLRYQITRDTISMSEYQRILNEKQFNDLYARVCERIDHENEDEFTKNLGDYKKRIKRLELAKVDRELKLLDQQNETIYVPLAIPAKAFSKELIPVMRELRCLEDDEMVDGELIWQAYLDIIHSGKDDFIKKKIDLKKIYGIMVQFMFSIFAHSRQVTELLRFCDLEYHEKYKILYLQDWREVYDYESGIRDEKFKEAAFL